ncbi:tellurite resistance TerB family protein [Archangium violaceum]|uniref:TerB family tellurite resistance protein n=1 Tax=Archangium violaceum TaxID=83451 RepID=UPI0036DCBD53
MTLTAEDRFNIEVIKLLLQVAWVDREISKTERMVVLGLGRSWSVPEAELHALMDRLDIGGTLPEPDLEVLRTRPDEVLEAARALCVSDGKLAEGEKAMLERITSRLGVTP